MKHSWKITAILLVMFLVTQLIGLAVINSYVKEKLPYGMQPPEDIEPKFSLVSILIAFVMAIFLVLLLTKLKAAVFLRLWFFIVVVIAIGITIQSFLSFSGIPYAMYLATLIALPLAFFKIFRQQLIVHNLTELMIYPGIAAVFVPILNVWTIIILLIVISIYDMYAVWHSKFMQNMAKFQINELKFFAGFFIPYIGKKDRVQLRQIKQKYKNKSSMEKAIKKKKIKANLAILGGGDVIFPIIAAGIFLKAFGLLPALFVTLGATLALLSLFTLAKKGKFYPAMPFLTTGIFVGMLVGWLISLI